MLNKNYLEIKEVIKKFGLNLINKRKVSLFTITCVNQGYFKFLKQRLGFSHRAMLAISVGDFLYIKLDEEYVSKEMKKLLNENIDIDMLEKKFLKPARDFAQEYSKKLKSLKIKNNNCRDILTTIINSYPQYFSSLGVYMCIFRISKFENNLTKELFNKISLEKEPIASLYPDTEVILDNCFNILGKEGGFEGGLLKYLTYSEMKDFLNGKNILQHKMNLLKKRREKYLYFYVPEIRKESIIVDKKLINKVYKNFFTVRNRDVEIIKGKTAYKGIAKGRVLNLLKNKEIKDLKNNFILVASMTNPQDINLIRKSKAIVTDEGGLLSHAAIIARELKKPCIIGTKIITQVLQDGDLVEVDADKGIVKIIKK